MIWAQARGRVIGRHNDLPWHLPEDLAHFTATTRGHPVLMGRRQWESLPDRYRPLPGRENLVITRSAGYHAPGALVFSSLPAAIEHVRGTEAWICGGGQIYEQAMPWADVLMVTEIDLDVAGDVVAPAITPDWRIDEQGPWRTGAGGLRFRILRYVRASGSRDAEA